MGLTATVYAADTPRVERVSDNAFTLDHLDRWMRYAVFVLHRGGIQTDESCQGGRGHAFPEPTIRFEGTRDDAFRAVALARAHGLPAHHLRQFWRLNDEGAELPAWGTDVLSASSFDEGSAVRRKGRLQTGNRSRLSWRRDDCGPYDLLTSPIETVTVLAEPTPARPVTEVVGLDVVAFRAEAVVVMHVRGARFNAVGRSYFGHDALLSANVRVCRRLWAGPSR